MTVSIPEAVEPEMPEPERKPRKVLIISADIGSGHDLPARSIARDFREEDPEAQVSVVNGLAAMGDFVTRTLRDNSAWMFRWVPWWFDLQYRVFMNVGVARWFSRRLLVFFGAKGLLRLIRAHNPDLIVSTYPGVTAVLGELRRQGRLEVPCYASITDIAGLQFWAHPGIDLHLVTHPESIEEVEGIAGPGSVRWSRPPTNPSFMVPRSREDARDALDLPHDRQVITVSGGGWGVGDLIGAASVALEVEDAEVLCLCGDNEDLQRRVSERFGDHPRVRVMGFTNQMSDVMAASDALVHSTVGMTLLESLVRGCPVISYGFGYGHVRVSNEALERFGLARVARSQDDLRVALADALESKTEPNNSFIERSTAAALILGSERRIRPLPSWRVRAVRTLTALSAAAVVGVWTFTASLAYTFVSAFADTHAITSVATPTADVGVLVDASASQLPALEKAFAASGIQVSFALLNGTPQVARQAAHFGDQTVAKLPDSGLIGWVNTDKRLDHLVRELHLRHHFLYTTSGPSVVQWLIARHLGGQAVSGAVRIGSTRQIPQNLRAGEVIELRVRTVNAALPQIHDLAQRLQSSGLSGVPVATLLRASGRRV